MAFSWSGVEVKPTVRRAYLSSQTSCIRPSLSSALCGRFESQGERGQAPEIVDDSWIENPGGSSGAARSTEVSWRSPVRLRAVESLHPRTERSLMDRWPTSPVRYPAPAVQVLDPRFGPDTTTLAGP